MEKDFDVVKLQQKDSSLFVELVELFNTVFEEASNIASEKQLKKLLNKSDFHAIVIIKNNKIIGGLTAYELEKYYTDKKELYIYDIAVKTAFHNQGIGKTLMTYLKKYATKNNIESIFVQAYSEEEQAVRFYESTIGSGKTVEHFTFEIKEDSTTK
jgi:aminoglycoside 3-N-acetyltransferase I